MFRNIFFAAVLAGIAAGLLLSAIQQVKVIPLILEAETYETAAHTHEDGTSHAHAAEATEEAVGDAEPWAPGDGLERSLYTALANVLVSIGFGLVIGAVAILAGLPFDARTGLYWGVAGFLTFTLAPSFGLAPELPGMPAADLGARQLWWWGTVVATGAGLLILARLGNALGFCIAAVLAVAPHVIGAPHPHDLASDVPANLATSFAAATITASAVFWLVLGPLMGWLVTRFSAPRPIEAAA